MTVDNRKILYAEFTALPGRQEEVAQLISGFAQTVREEPGNLVFAVSQKTDSPADFFVYEEYENEAAFHAHISAEYGERFNAALGPLVSGGGSTLTFLNPV